MRWYGWRLLGFADTASVCEEWMSAMEWTEFVGIIVFGGLSGAFWYLVAAIYFHDNE